MTIIITSIIAITVIAIIIKEIKNKLSGKGSCSCGCAGCMIKDSCHKK